jgi:hypothetical protein
MMPQYVLYRWAFIVALGMLVFSTQPATAFFPLTQTSAGTEPLDAPPAYSVENQVSRTPYNLLNPAPPAHHEKLTTDILMHVSERPLADLLNDLARIAGLRMRINDRLEREIVSRQRLEGTLEEILDGLGADFNLVWFAERDLIDIARADTATVKTFQIGRTSDRQIRDAIARFGLVNADFALEVDESNGIARVFAPPRLSARIESIIVGLRAPVEIDTPVEVIRFGQRARSGE